MCLYMKFEVKMYKNWDWGENMCQKLWLRWKCDNTRVWGENIWKFLNIWDWGGNVSKTEIEVKMCENLLRWKFVKIWNCDENTPKSDVLLKIYPESDFEVKMWHKLSLRWKCAETLNWGENVSKYLFGFKKIFQNLKVKSVRVFK